MNKKHISSAYIAIAAVFLSCPSMVLAYPLDVKDEKGLRNCAMLTAIAERSAKEANSSGKTVFQTTTYKNLNTNDFDADFQLVEKLRKIMTPALITATGSYSLCTGTGFEFRLEDAPIIASECDKPVSSQAMMMCVKRVIERTPQWTDRK